MDKDSEGIDSEAQLNMIKTLKGEIGWHQGIQTGQRIAYGGGDEYSPNFLTDNGKQSYEGLEAFEDNLALDDMVWYKNIDSKGTGDDDINEILKKAEEIENNSNQLLNFTNIIKKESMDFKKDIIEHLWRVVISDKTVDQYESNLMRRICGLIYFPDKECAEIKLNLLNLK